MVVMDRKDYIAKATNLLSQPEYRTIDRDPTNKLKAKLFTVVRNLKRETGLEDHFYNYMYLTGCTSTKFYVLPKIHKANTPLRPMVSSRGSVTYGVAKVLAKILKPLVRKSLHHVHSTTDFVERVRKVTLQPGKCLCSNDVTALFTSVPVDPALNTYRAYWSKTPHYMAGQYSSAEYNTIIRVLPTQYLFFLSRPVL